MRSSLAADIESFNKSSGFKGKGALCVALVTTRHAIARGLPLVPEALLTDGGGQVLGLGKGAVQSILADYGISKVLAEEGGRTSRGSIGNMRDYVAFLNRERFSVEELKALEAFWIKKVTEFFAAKPIRVKLDVSKSVRALVKDIVEQAQQRQQGSPGMQYAGALLQHLVGAKLDRAIGEGKFSHHSFSTSDSQSGRAGDFELGGVSIHVTTSPSESLIQKCIANINAGLKPLIVTSSKGQAVAEGLAANAGYAGRIDVFEAEQFIAANIYELGKFEQSRQRDAVRDVVARYNEIIDEVETDPSLKIEIQ